MRRGFLLFAFLLFVAGTAGYLLAQDAPDEPRRGRQRGDRRFPRPDRGRLPKMTTTAMELDGDFAYCVVGTVIFKVSIEKMEVVAKQELEPSASQTPKPEDVIKKLDRDGDGKVSKEEFPNADMFDRLDRDGDGFITEEEIPERLLRLASAQRRPPTLSPPIIKFLKEKVVVLLGNTVFKLNKSDLTLEGAVQLEPEGTIEKKPKKEKKGEEEKKEEDDFGF